jgi:hypothetical protein
MTVAVNHKPRREFVLLRDRALPEAERTVFILRPLEIFDRTRVSDYRSTGMLPSAVGVEILRMALDGWRNFKLADGTEVVYERGPSGFATDDTLRYISDHDAAEILADAVREEEVTPKQAGE